MQFIEAGLTLSLLLALLTTSLFYRLPMSDRARRYLVEHRGMRGWGFIQNLIKFLLNIATVAALYLLMGLTLTAHIAVVGYEVIWNYIAAPLIAKHLELRGGAPKLLPPG